MYWNKQLQIARKRNLYNDAALLSKAIEQLETMRSDADLEKQRMGDMICEILTDMIQRRKLYERLQAHFRGTYKSERCSAKCSLVIIVQDNLYSCIPFFIAFS